MTRSLKMTTFLISAYLFALGSVNGQQPPDIVTSDANGNTAMGSGALAGNAGGAQNTAAGYNAMASNTTGSQNVAVGQGAMLKNTQGTFNTAVGDGALLQNTTGIYNTAFGYDTLNSTTTGYYNAACGALALESNTTGHDNAAFGQVALWYNTTGTANTAVGAGALKQNITGNYNTASGFQVMELNTSGNGNVAMGNSALHGNTTGNNNVALGPAAMLYNDSGTENTALGYNALGTNRGGSYNIALGTNAGYYLRGSRYNIDIGNVGAAADAGTIRIGTSSQQAATYIAGIQNAHVTGGAVYISSTGQLGVLASSERYKTAVAPIGSNSEKLRQLRPVTFKLRSDPQGMRQYGLIAEEVDKVYPELVIRSEKGRIEGVRYEELAPMLLNELQVQQHRFEEQAKQTQAQIRELQRAVAGLTTQRRRAGP